jgi:hypothetical protein
LVAKVVEANGRDEKSKGLTAAARLLRCQVREGDTVILESVYIILLAVAVGAILQFAATDYYDNQESPVWERDKK